jgi:hypothetical protein
VPGRLVRQPIGGPGPAVERRPLGTWQLEGPQACGVDERKMGQRLGVDAVGLGVPGQESAAWLWPAMTTAPTSLVDFL